MESSFAIIAEPNRRTILSLLASSERSVGEIERRLRIPQTSVSKHLRVLREAGFVEARVEAQRRVYRSEEHTSELQSQSNLVCRLLLEKKKSYQRMRRSSSA